MKQEKYKSKIFWLGISGVAVTFLIQLGVIDAGQGVQVNQIIAGIASLLGVFGVWNDAGNATEY